MADGSGSGQKRILLVEDERLVAMMEMRALENAGFQAIVAGSGTEAIEKVRAMRGNIDLILMDINLGPGMDGTATAQEILRTYDIPVVFLSGHTEKEIVDRTEKITSYGYIVKNSGIAILTASIKMAFKLHDAYRALEDSRMAIRESEEKYRTLVENINDVIFDLDSEGRFSYVSPSMEHRYGYRSDEIMGKRFLDYVHPDDVALLTASFGHISHGVLEHAEFRFVDRAGQDKCVRISSRLIAREEGGGSIIGIMTDITERKRAEEQLNATLRQLHDIIEFLPDPTFVVDHDHKVVAWNKAMEELTGVEKESILGQGEYSYSLSFYGSRRPMLIDFFDLPPDVFEANYSYLRRVGNTIYAETFVPQMNAKENVHLWGAASPLFDSAGQRIGAIEVIRDITERKRMEEQLTQSVEDKDILMKELQHRVKNNLNIMASLLRLEQGSVQDEHSKAIFLDAITRIQSMALIYEQMKDTSALDRVDLKDYMRAILSLLISTYALDPDRVKLTLTIDQERIEAKRAVPLGLILNELISNAIKYAYPDGASGELRVRLEGVGDSIALVVADDGVGIPARARTGEGKGLGLELIEMLARQIDGEFLLESGRGTSARIVFKK